MCSSEIKPASHLPVPMGLPKGGNVIRTMINEHPLAVNEQPMLAPKKLP